MAMNRYIGKIVLPTVKRTSSFIKTVIILNIIHNISNFLDVEIVI